MLVELNSSGFKFFDTFDNVDKYQCSMSYHFHLKSGTRSKLINHQLTPILLTDEGKIMDWYVCSYRCLLIKLSEM